MCRIEVGFLLWFARLHLCHIENDAVSLLVIAPYVIVFSHLGGLVMDYIQWFRRLDKTASILDIKVECQELEKFSVINRFARFHSRVQAGAAETSSASGVVGTMLKPVPQRYVTALPLPSKLPHGVQCLSLWLSIDRSRPNLHPVLTYILHSISSSMHLSLVVCSIIDLLTCKKQEERKDGMKDKSSESNLGWSIFLNRGQLLSFLEKYILVFVYFHENLRRIFWVLAAFFTPS